MTPEQIAAIVAHFSYELEPTTPLPDWNTVAMETVYLRNELATLRAERDALRSAADPVIGLLDGLVAESGRGVDWGEEDAFRMGEWFEAHDIAAIERLRALKGGA